MLIFLRIKEFFFIMIKESADKAHKMLCCKTIDKKERV